MSEELPKGWVWATVEDLLAEKIINGRSVPTKEGGFPVLKLNAIRDGYIDSSVAKEGAWTEEEAKPYILRPGDFLLSRGNGTLSLVGRGGLVSKECKVAFPDTMMRIRVNPDLIDEKYFCLMWNGPLVRREIEYSARTTAGIYKVNQGILRNIPIPVPPLAEQRRIVDVLEVELSRLDAAKTLVNESSARVEGLWDSVLAGVVEGSLLHGPGHHYEYRPVSDCVIVQGGIQKQPKRRPVENKHPFLRVANVQREHLDLAEVHEVELFDGELEKYRLEEGDLLVVEGNGSPQHIGRGAMWRGQIVGAVHQNHLIRLRPTGKLRPKFLELTWNSPFVSRQLRDAASSTSGLMTLSVTKVKKIKIPIPSLEEQDKIIDIASSWRSRVDAARNSTQQVQRRANTLRQALLTAAFTGKLVPQDPSDGSVAVLLERALSAWASAPKPKRARRSTTKPSTRLASAADIRTPENPQPVHTGEQTALEF